MGVSSKITRRRGLGAAIAFAALLLLGACGPEAGRARGGGLGADIGNHAPQGEIPASKIWNTRKP